MKEIENRGKTTQLRVSYIRIAILAKNVTRCEEMEILKAVEYPLSHFLMLLDAFIMRNAFIFIFKKCQNLLETDSDV